MDLLSIKSRIDCVIYAKKCGLPIHRPGDRCVSPLRKDAKNKNNFVVYESFFYDFVSRQGGDVIDLCALLKHGGDRGAAIRDLAKMTGTECNPANWVKYTQNLCNLIEKWHKALRPEDIDYLHSRRITDETIEELKIGYTGSGILAQKKNGEVLQHYAEERICIPYWKNKYICYWIARAFQENQKPKYLKAVLDDLNDNAPWGLNTLDRDSPLVIAEGAFDALSFYQEGFRVLATMGGTFNAEQYKQVLAAAQSSSSVMLTFDFDEAGEGFTLDMAKFFFSHHIPFSVVRIPNRYKDISDYYADGGDLKALLHKMQDGIEYLADSYADEDDFKAFIYQVRRYIDKPSIVKLFKAVNRTGNFESDILAEIKKSAMAAPSEFEIAQSVVKKYKLLYHPKVGFYEYIKNKWCRQSDEQIKQYISDALGRYKSGSKCSSILGLVKAETVQEVAFNRKRVMNFINGTLELEGLSFREHRAEDYCDYCMEYPYTPGKYYAPWSDFIDEVTGGDERKSALLQEAAGYVLYPNNDFQKAIILIGGGSNGKSVYLKVITALYGEENISNIEMSALAKDFQAIHLMNSLLNISAETKSDVSGAESIFKQIVGGDSISSCFKGKDMISFRPRAKLFVACNEFMKSRDTTEGWLRRLCFVNFPMHYVERPKEKNDRQIIPDFDKQFYDHLPEVFNWALDGYRALKEANGFTETDEQAEIIGEYKEVINPLISFVHEYKMDSDAISNDEFYRDYTVWCEECGHRARNKQSFLKAVVPILRQYRKDIEKPENGFKLNGNLIRGIRKVALHDCGIQMKF